MAFFSSYLVSMEISPPTYFISGRWSVILSILLVSYTLLPIATLAPRLLKTISPASCADTVLMPPSLQMYVVWAEVQPNIIDATSVKRNLLFFIHSYVIYACWLFVRGILPFVWRCRCHGLQ